ncbi:hypothetical protein BABA_20316 [Neobacillus bataviensis LMG 21833]|uniref:Uncharacterized protein n=1 Tax=Neobacillus bataviensis LMG 21833 TaxID=1117379 RepID=K6C325_9BACI|nr:hypothetical protein [Neobacillus bataviensis]EKN65520.1 hypothetical protein BABA_20316 [Neobacillus bataviensis LMG 21833]
MAINRDGVRIGSVSGGIVNFGGADIIAPISITKTVIRGGEGNQGAVTKTITSNQPEESSLIDLISRS